MTAPADGNGEAQALNRPLRLLAVDDEAPSLADLVYELRALPEVGEVIEASSAENALRALRSSSFDAVFLDVRMPGLDGLELGRVLNQFKTPPPIVFVTAFDNHAVEAFDIDAVDYLLKPVRRDRLGTALTKVVQKRRNAEAALPASKNGATGDRGLGPALIPKLSSAAGRVDSPVETERNNTGNETSGAQGTEPTQFDGEMISLEVGGRIRVIHRSDIMFVSASGDYVRLHVGTSSVLVRVAMSTLEDKWSSVGFVRIHRSFLVALAHISEVRVERGRGYVVVVGDRLLPVSRRLGPQLKARLIEDAARRGRR